MEDMNSGYTGYSKSNRAVIAESNGIFPITECVKRTKLQAETIKEFFPSDEWHHVSSFATAVDFYDTNKILDGITAEVLAFDKKIKVKKSEFKKEAPIIHKGCEVSFTEWSGAGRNKSADFRELKNVTMMIKGSKAKLIFKDENGRKQEINKFIDKGDFNFKTKEDLKIEKERIKLNKLKVKDFYKKVAGIIKGKDLYTASYFRSFFNDEGKLVQTSNEFELTKINRKEFKEILDNSIKDSNGYVDSYLKRTFDQCDDVGFSRFGLEKVLVVTDDLNKTLKSLRETNPKLKCDEGVCHVKKSRARRRP
jgi:hypothetical protein